MTLRPPEGYVTWLDYAVATVDTRAVEIERLFTDDNSAIPVREQIQQAVEDELRALRRAAGSSDTLPPRYSSAHGLTPLRWRPRIPPELPPTMKFPEDIARLVQVAREAGYDLPCADAERVWKEHSEDICANWLAVGNDDAKLLRVILDRTAVLRVETPGF